jgi:acetyl-CoA carboxylase biotin carboxyl carrier protein
MSDAEPLEAVRRLLHLADTFGLAELEVEEDGFKITIRGSEGAPAGARSVYPAAADGVVVPAVEDETSQYHAVVSPMTGVFYRAASPDAPPFIEEGDRVEEGQPVGLIEAMKVFSEIPADREGRVVRILATTGTLISQGDPLMLVDPEG